MKDIIMKSPLLVIILTLLCVSVHAQLSSGYYMVPSSALSDEQNGYLESKLKQYLAAGGVSSIDGYYPIVTVGRFMEVESQLYSGGMENMYKVDGDITVSIEFEGASASLASTTVSVSGVGKTKKVALNNCIKSFKLQRPQVEEIFKNAAGKAGAIINAFAETKMREIKALIAKKECTEAADLVSEIPVGSKYEKDILALTSTIDECVTAQIKYDRAQENIASDRAFKLDSLSLTADERIAKIREQGLTRRTEIESRSKAKIQYNTFLKW